MKKIHWRSARIYLFWMNKCMALNGDNIFDTYGLIIEIMKSYEN